MVNNTHENFTTLKKQNKPQFSKHAIHEPAKRMLFKIFITRFLNNSYIYCTTNSS